MERFQQEPLPGWAGGGVKLGVHVKRDLLVGGCFTSIKAPHQKLRNNPSPPTKVGRASYGWFGARLSYVEMETPSN